MTVLAHELKAYGTQFTTQSDVGAVGGVDDDSKMIAYADIENEAVQLVSEGDSGLFDVLVDGEDMAGAPAIQQVAVNGTTPATYAATYKRIYRARATNFTQTVPWCIESQTPITTGTAQGGTATSIQLDAGAPLLRRGLVIRLDGGTGAGQIRRLREWDDPTTTAEIDQPWDVTPDATTTYRVATGLVSAMAPSQVVEVRRLHVKTPTPIAAGTQKIYFDKFHLRNESADPFANGVLALVDPSAKLRFGLAATVNDTQQVTNRLTPPSGITFDTVPATVPATLASGEAIGVWVELTRDPGDPEIDDEVIAWALTGDP